MSSNMYPESDGCTHNLFGGSCKKKGHQCSYCFVPDQASRWPKSVEKYSGKLRYHEKAELASLPKGPMIFASSMADIMHRKIKSVDIMRALAWYKKREQGRKFLFQSKDPHRFSHFDRCLYPEDSIFATTIESNRDLGWSTAPTPYQRARYMTMLGRMGYEHRMVTIEPIGPFSLKAFERMLLEIDPDIIYIGANSKLKCLDCGYGGKKKQRFRWKGKKRCTKCGSTNITNAHGLQEPKEEQVVDLIRALRPHKAEVRIKDNLYRLIPRTVTA